MIDILLVALLGWCMIRGWYKGPHRLAIDLITTMSVFYVASKTSLWIRDLMTTEEERKVFSAWVTAHMHSFPPASAVYGQLGGSTAVGLGLSQQGTMVAQNIYMMTITLSVSLGMILGIQLILAAVGILWPAAAHLTRWERVVGVMAGMGLGVYVSTWLISAVSLITWFNGFEWVDAAISTSILIKTLIYPGI